MHPKNIAQVFQKTVERQKNRPCFRFRDKDRWRTLTWKEAFDRVSSLALGLTALGVRRGDRVAIMSGTCVEWTLCDLAILSLGAVVVPVYASNTPEQVQYVLNHAQVKILCIQDQPLWERVKSIKHQLKSLKQVVVMQGMGGNGTLGLLEVQSRGSGDEQAWRHGFLSIEKNDLASIVYTSGTTGHPKGVVLAQSHLLAGIEATMHHFPEVTEHDSSLTVLPLSHIFARTMQFWQIGQGYTQIYAQGLDTLASDLQKTRPTFFTGVPRIFEKIYEKIEQKNDAAPPHKKEVFEWAKNVALSRSRLNFGESLQRPWDYFQARLAELLVFRKVRSIFGGRLRFAVSGGAPLSQELAEFFSGAGITLLEGYGLTETTGGAFISALSQPRFGTVGKPVKGMECKIAEDGEILIRGPLVFKEYYKNPKATEEAFAAGGWFKTGDVGELDSEGNLKITDRKKDIIITAAGKNIAPQNIETELKSIPFVHQAMVYGDRKKYLTALVTLHREALEKYARRHHLLLNGDSLSDNPEVYRIVQKAIQAKNKNLASYETIKDFVVLDHDLTQEAGEITPTLKLRRKFVSEKYQDMLEALY